MSFFHIFEPFLTCFLCCCYCCFHFFFQKKPWCNLNPIIIQVTRLLFNVLKKNETHVSTIKSQYKKNGKMPTHYITCCIFHLHLWFLEFQVLSILYGEVNMLQNYVYTFLICAVKRQKSNHAVVINLYTQTERMSFVGNMLNMVKIKTNEASRTSSQRAFVSFLNFVLLMVSELSSIIEYMSGSRYLEMKRAKNNKQYTMNLNFENLATSKSYVPFLKLKVKNFEDILEIKFKPQNL